MNDVVKELVKLAEENPGMEIKAAVESDVCPDSDADRPILLPSGEARA